MSSHPPAGEGHAEILDGLLSLLLGGEDVAIDVLRAPVRLAGDTELVPVEVQPPAPDTVAV